MEKVPAVMSMGDWDVPVEQRALAVGSRFTQFAGPF